MLTSDSLLILLRRLEVELHTPEALNAARLDALIHPDFREFGRSGARYDRVQILALLREEAPSVTIHAQDFTLLEPAPSVALLTYRSAHVQADGELARHSNRMSLWKQEAAGWQMIFHQGTPAPSSTAKRTETPCSPTSSSASATSPAPTASTRP